MARVGFKKTYATWDVAANPDDGELYALLCDYIAAAGFATQSDTDGLCFWPVAGVYENEEDRPAWKLGRLQNVRAVNTATWGGPSVQYDLEIDDWGVPIEVAACFDGDHGVFWLLINGGLTVATRERRLPADMRAGVAARFGLVTPAYSNRFYRAWWVCVDEYYGVPGELISEEESNGHGIVWSPISGDRPPSANPVPPALTIPPLKMIAPVFASGPCGGAPIYAGELLDVMVATDGYAEGEEVMPGWGVVDATGAKLVLRVPESFDNLDAP